MTSEVTKRGLWFGFNGGGEPDGTYCTMKTGDPNEQFWVPYDTTLALVAEAYEAAAEFARDTADQEQADDGVVWADLAQVMDAIESCTPADALAAREARDKQVREEALRVKPLVWGRAEKSGMNLQADTPSGRYYIALRAEYGWMWWRPASGPAHMGIEPTEKAAKDAAQADYERRILSALIEGDTE